MELILPFLNEDPAYAHGVELGMSVIAPMTACMEEIRGYFRTENEEQIRLAAHRYGYNVAELKPWRWKKKYTGWVWMVLARKISEEVIG